MEHDSKLNAASTSRLQRALRWFEHLAAPFAPCADHQPPRTLGRFLRWSLRGAERPVLGLCIASVAMGLTDAAVFWMVGALVDRALAAGPETFFAEEWPWLILAFFVIGAARPAAMVAQSAFSSLAVGPALFPMSVWRLHRHTLGQSMGFFEEDFTGRLAQKQMQTGTAVTSVTIDTLTALGALGAYVLTMIAALAAADVWLAALAGFWTLGFLAMLYVAVPIVRRRSAARAEARAGVTGQLVDSLGHIQTVKLFAHAGREEVAAQRALERFREAALSFGRAMLAVRAGLALMNTVATMAMLGLGLWLWSAGAASIGAVAAAAMLTLRLTQMSGWISMTAVSIFGELGAIEDGVRTLSPPHRLVDRPGARRETPKGDIRFEDVSFRYGRPSGGVSGLSFEVREGEKVALVGPSGAGKSTTVSLLLRLHDVEAGRVTIGGADVRDVAQDALRRSVAAVTQDPAIFNRSALDNILYGRPAASADEAADAAKRARAHDFIAELRDGRGRAGYDARLGERGVKLSGGQRQRIALARAILKKAPVLVLDEATSALDSEVEAEIQAALREAMAGKTVIAIAHRLSTIAQMDRIVVLDAGRVAEEGAHRDLLARGGLYARLWSRQSGGFFGLEAAE